MVSGKIVDGESAVVLRRWLLSGAVDIWFFSYSQLPTDSPACSVRDSLLISAFPFSSETGKTAAVGRDHHIAVRCHKGEVPAAAPELADGLLRAPPTVEDRRIFLLSVEFRGNTTHVHISLPSVVGTITFSHFGRILHLPGVHGSMSVVFFTSSSFGCLRDFIRTGLYGASLLPYCRLQDERRHSPKFLRQSCLSPL